jgi:hypothetical protein
MMRKNSVLKRNQKFKAKVSVFFFHSEKSVCFRFARNKNNLAKQNEKFDAKEAKKGSVYFD